MAIYTTVSLNSVPLTIKSATPTRRQKTRKSIIGNTLVQTKIIGLTAQQWEIQLNGIITGTDTTDLSTKRANIENLDSVEVYVYIDGIHNGNYLVDPGSLQFNDTGETGGLSFEYSMTIIEW